MSNSHGGAAEREARLRLQQEALDKLFACGWTLRRIAVATGVSDVSVLGWEKKGILARPGPHARLIAAAMNASQEIDSVLARTRGRLNKEQRNHRDQLLKQCGLYNTAGRINTLREIMREHRLKVPEMATRLGIGRTTLQRYLDPRYTGAVVYPAAKRIQSLRESQILEPDGLSLDERFHLAARRLFGRYYDTGFPENDRRNYCMIRRLSSLTGLAQRTIYNNLPPYDSKPSHGPRSQPRRKLVEAFELAAHLLANLD